MAGMTAQRKLVVGFGLKILIPAILAAAGIAGVMLHIFNGIFNEANALDKEYTKRAAHAALGAVLGKIVLTTTDNSLWDDAVRNAYEPIDVAWVEDTWQINTELGIYDVAFIVDGDGKTLVGYEHGKLLAIAARDFLGRGYDELMGKLPDDGRTFGAASAVFAGKTWPIAAAAGLIMPATDGVKLPQAKPNRLIFGKYTNEKLLAEIAEQYVLDDLGLVPAGSEVSDSVMVRDTTGAAVGKLTWTSRRTGDVAPGHGRPGLFLPAQLPRHPCQRGTSASQFAA